MESSYKGVCARTIENSWATSRTHLLRNLPVADDYRWSPISRSILLFALVRLGQMFDRHLLSASTILATGN